MHMMDDDDEGCPPESEIETLFNLAAEHVGLAAASGHYDKIDQKQVLELYGFYKVATVGECKDKKPGIFDLRGRAKWTAWYSVSSLSKEDAMIGYTRLAERLYGWTPPPPEPPKDPSSSSTAKHTTKHHRRRSSLGGTIVSTIAISPEARKAEEECKNSKTIFEFAKDNAVSEIEAWLHKDDSDPNVRDKEGLTPLHWSVDRGHMEATQMLLKAGADPNLTDNDGETPLDYAITCKHDHIIALLQSPDSNEPKSE